MPPVRTGTACPAISQRSPAQAHPLGHRRGRRPGPRQPALARGPRLSLRQRGLASPARVLPGL